MCTRQRYYRRVPFLVQRRVAVARRQDQHDNTVVALPGTRLISSSCERDGDTVSPPPSTMLFSTSPRLTNHHPSPHPHTGVGAVPIRLHRRRLAFFPGVHAGHFQQCHELRYPLHQECRVRVPDAVPAAPQSVCAHVPRPPRPDRIYVGAEQAAWAVPRYVEEKRSENVGQGYNSTLE